MNHYPPLKVVVLISGNGSNLQAMMDAITTHRLLMHIKAVISSDPTAYGLKRAEAEHIPTHTLAAKNFINRADYDAALAQCIAAYAPDLIVLAGFMRILNNEFLQRFKDKVVNIHPSLLPNFPGLSTHELAIASGMLEHGCSIHYVTENLDAGPVIAQAAIKIAPDDTVATLKEKVHQAEHFLYPVVLNWFAQRRVQRQHDQVYIDRIPIPPQGLRFML